jgi:hypothetical protein
MTKKKSNVIQFPIRPPTNPENPNTRNGSVGVQRETQTFFLAGKDELTFYDYAFVFCDERGKEERFEGFLTFGEAMHAGREFADECNAVFES